MKRLLSFLSCALVLMLAGCTSDEVRVENPGQGLTSNLRTPEEAVALAKSLYQSRHNSRADVSVADVAVIGSSASRAGADTLIYAVNFADNQGFTLVSASYVGVPVIGYGDKGNYNSEDVSNNECFSFYMDAAKDYVASGGLYPGGPIGGVIIDPIRPDTTFVIIIPRIPVDYGQIYPEGQLFSNKMAGCVQTACAMVLAYAERPTLMTYTDPSINLSAENLDWEVIKKHVNSTNSITFADIYDHCSNCNATSATHDVLSRICKELGYRNNADPQFWGTSATMEAARNTLKNMLTGYVSEIRNLNAPYTDMMECMKGSTSVCIIGGDSSDDLSHVWICDGGDGMEIKSKAMLATGEWETRVEKHYYYHFNWGESGNYNGYFFAGVFDQHNPSRANYNQNVRYFYVGK